jgi:hypothetical protein
MGRRPNIGIKIHGEILRDFIVSRSSINQIAEQLGVSRQTVHSIVTKGLITGKYLSDLTKILNLSSEEVSLLSRQSENVFERLVIENRRLKDGFVCVRKILDELGFLT